MVILLLFVLTNNFFLNEYFYHLLSLHTLFSFLSRINSINHPQHTIINNIPASTYLLFKVIAVSMLNK